MLVDLGHIKETRPIIQIGVAGKVERRYSSSGYGM